MALPRKMQRMREYVLERLEESGLYTIVSSANDELRLEDVHDQVEDPQKYALLLLGKMSQKEFQKRMRAFRDEDIFRGAVFYKDRENFLVSMAREGNWKRAKSLKRYNQTERNNMIHARGLEKQMIDRHTKQLVYFQPNSERLGEAIREYTMKDIILDYDHLSREDRGHGFARDGISADFKLADLVNEFTGPAHLVTNDARKLVLLREIKR